MPGGGKSTVGRQLARRLRVPFSDCDELIERELGCTIRAFFEAEGEARFREIEAEVLFEQTRTARGVLATGGGIVLSAANRELLQHSTACVYLRSTPEELFRRLRQDTKRPLLQVADPLQRLRELHSLRDPLYGEAAHFAVDTGRPSIPTLVNMIVMQLELAGAIETSHADTPVDKPVPPG